MPGIKTIPLVVAALLAAAGTYAAPFRTRGLDEVVTQCNHNFAYASSLSPVGHFHWCRVPTMETNPGYYMTVTPSTMVHTIGTPISSISSTVLAARLLSVRSISPSVKK